jgi:hypothetical protein
MSKASKSKVSKESVAAVSDLFQRNPQKLFAYIFPRNVKRKTYAVLGVHLVQLSKLVGIPLIDTDGNSYAELPAVFVRPMRFATIAQIKSAASELLHVPDEEAPSKK